MKKTSKIIITCSSEDLDFVIKNLTHTQDDKTLLVSIPLEIYEDKDNYEFLSKSECVKDWEFEKPSLTTEELPKEVLEDVCHVPNTIPLSLFKLAIKRRESLAVLIDSVWSIYRDSPAIIVGSDLYRDLLQNIFNGELYNSTGQLKEISNPALNSITEMLIKVYNTESSITEPELYINFCDTIRDVYKSKPKSFEEFVMKFYLFSKKL